MQFGVFRHEASFDTHRVPLDHRIIGDSVPSSSLTLRTTCKPFSCLLIPGVTAPTLVATIHILHGIALDQALPKPPTDAFLEGSSFHTAAAGRIVANRPTYP